MYPGSSVFLERIQSSLQAFASLGFLSTTVLPYPNYPTCTAPSPICVAWRLLLTSSQLYPLPHPTCISSPAHIIPAVPPVPSHLDHLSCMYHPSCTTPLAHFTCTPTCASPFIPLHQSSHTSSGTSMPLYKPPYAHTDSSSPIFFSSLLSLVRWPA